MPRIYTFRKITGTNLAWHPELGEGEGKEYWGDWLWLDGQLEGGYWYSLTLSARMAEGIIEAENPKNWPSVDLHILTPEAQLLHGKIIEFFSLEGPPSAPEKQGIYFRQYCDVHMQIKHWGELEEVSGTAVHEFGAGREWFPFEVLHQ